MKKNKVYKYSLKGLILIMALVSVGFFTSCTEDEPGPPEIHSVRLTDPETAGMNMEQVTLGSYLVIQGENLATTTDVYFNGLEAFFYGTYVTDKNLLVQVPDTTPTVATNPEKAINKIRVVTKHGEITHDLTILPPPPIVDSISNEFALPGDQIKIFGKYFYFVESLQFPDSVITSEGFSASEGGNILTATVPEGIGAGDHLHVTSASGRSEENLASMFHDTASLTGQFEHPGFDVEGNAEIYNTDDNPSIPSIKDNYIYFFATSINPGTFFQQNLAMETQYVNYQEMFTYPDSTIIANDFSTSKLALEFEIFVFKRDGWNSGFFEIAFLQNEAWTNAFRNYFYYYNVTPDQYGKWVTKRIPLDEFYVNADPTMAAPFTYAKIKGTPINMNFKNPTEEAGGVAIPILNIAFDNFRIVKLSE